MLRRVIIFVLISSMVVLPNATAAQDGEIVITITIPEFLQGFITPELLAEFEAQNPGVRVVIDNDQDGAFNAPDPNDIEGYLDDMQAYASSADVLYVTSLDSYVTRAGYLLDLAPLTSVDSALDINDFYPAVWESFQFDSGVWGVPLSADVILVAYNPAAFDQAGLAYPTESWTLDDYANAARALTIFNDAGEVETPGLSTFAANTAIFLRSLYNQGFYDPATFPAQPTFANPTLENILAQWGELEQAGYVSGPQSNTIVIGGTTPDSPPINITQSFGFASFNDNENPTEVALLPGGTAGLSVQGFAVSAGTQYPEIAYELAKFLSQSPQAANNFLGVLPARQSLAGTTADVAEGSFNFQRTLDADVLPVVEQALFNGLPLGETRFGEYLNDVIAQIRDDGVAPRNALQEAELIALDNLTIADTRATEVAIFVETPAIANVAPGEVVLDFGVLGFFDALPNQERWEQVAAEFAANDPEVGFVNLDSTFLIGASQAVTTYDCFYSSADVVSGGDLTNYLPLDPFMDADASFDRNDVLGTSLSSLQRDNLSWGFPINIQPLVLRYDAESLAQLGITPSPEGWSIETFVDAMRSLQFEYQIAPYDTFLTANSHLLMLIAAYGGLPLDFRTTPPTINFTDPASVEAIRGVLNLIEEELIAYDPTEGGGVIGFGFDPEADLPFLFPDTLGDFSFTPILTEGEETEYGLMGFPQGSAFNAVSYTNGAAYISNAAENPDACYRWISTLSQNPDLYSGLPARQSLVSLVQDENADFFSAFATTLSDPSTVVIPGSSLGDTTGVRLILEFALTRAMDDYLVNDVALEMALDDAQRLAEAVVGCQETLALSANTDGIGNFQELADCISLVDPDFAGFFSADN